MELFDLVMQSTVDDLKAEIVRVEASSKTMRDANKALREQDYATLRRMGFSDAHVEELKLRVQRGRDGFPDYALRNNDSTIDRLRRGIAEITKAEMASQHY